jgi:large subunit ribosomal protein L19e
MKRIRALRRRLRELKEKRIITQNVYRKLYTMAKSGAFKSKAELENYIKAQGWWRKR